MHIPWILYLIALANLPCSRRPVLTVKILHSDSEYEKPFIDSGTFLLVNKKLNQATTIRYADHHTVYGITVYDKFLAIALESIIIVRKISSAVSAEDICRIQLPERIQNVLLEFKFIDRERLFYCDTATCRSCILNSSNEPCHDYLLTLNGEKVEELVYAAIAKDTDENVNIRIVTNNAKSAAILRFPSDYVSSRSMNSSFMQSAEDIQIIDEHDLATAFSRRGYTFFVGSARRPYEPYINAKIEELITMSVRITRICVRDRTKDLESRIDMAVTCGNFSFRTNVRSLAAEYDYSRDELIIVFQAAETDENVVCKYDMAVIHNAFSQIWESCQNLSCKSSARECLRVQNPQDLPPHCMIFSRRADGHAMRTCSRFGGNYAKKPIDNCELELFQSSAYRYGWLEQFDVLKGQLIARLPNSNEDILSVKRLKEDSALFIVYSGCVLNRVSSQTHQTRSLVLWSLQLQQPQSGKRLGFPKYYIAIDSSKNRIFFVQDNEVKYAEITCSYFYDSCDSLEKSSWSDPMKCRWCAMENGFGYSFSLAKGNTCQFKTIDDFCTPFIEHVNIPSSSFINRTLFEVYGGKFDKLDEIMAKVCNFNCVVSTVGPSKLSCIVNMPKGALEHCDFYLEGKLGFLGRLNITFKSPQKHQTQLLTNTYPQYSKRNRTVASIFAVIVLAFLIILILHLLRRLHKHQQNYMKQRSKRISLTALNTSNATFVSNSPFNGFKGNDQFMKTFNPYANLFMEIDPKLKIPLKNLEFGDEIGKGNFGVVYRAVYRNSNGHIDVACKTIDSQSDGVVMGISEFLREGLIMANFDHPNVARLIGISSTDNNYPIIVTDFLAQGDLRHYIITPENKLTFGNLLDFGIQIAKGMTYLHDKKFIHRDLAARNCMLDANLVVKIADFGLSRDVSRCGMYQAIHTDRGIPIRWMPIESLEEQQYTFKADVWAYGVVLWELTTRGLIPYADLEFADILRLLKSGHRLVKPKGCPDNLYSQVMLACWMEDPLRRPTFSQLTEMVEDVVRQLRRGVLGGGLLDSHYERVSPRSLTTLPTTVSRCSTGSIVNGS